eukprot:TRINITY_DN80305_c0_g1_i1.p1 TRINITY_DN80305_c0_g1~~TRINITY_DN80305_c0_g1_i1.p1  ORF type:complete len:1132 (-),score=105.65 TRINITY_DN80305_c0_g1_i1:156-3551(-)
MRRNSLSSLYRSHTSASRSTASRASPVVDIHSHFLPKRWPDYQTKFGGGNWPALRHHEDSGEPLPTNTTFGYNHQCDAMLMQGGQDFRPVTKPLWDTAARIEDLDKHQIDYQILSATPILFQWTREAKQALSVAQFMNDRAVEICESKEAQGRLFALAQVPLQDIDMACKEIERITKASPFMKGVQIGNHLRRIDSSGATISDHDLDDAGIVTFLQHCASIGCPVLVHPWDMTTMEGRLKNKYMMQWTVGMPMETHLSLTAMILGGAFDKLPKSLKICFAHGGGAFPYLLGRLENAWHEREVARGISEHPPSHYLDRFTVDSAVFDGRALRLLVDTLGSERIMLGSDYPFPLGEQRIGSLVRDEGDEFIRHLTTKQREAILGSNALAFWNLADVAGAKMDEGVTEGNSPRQVVDTMSMLSKSKPEGNVILNFVDGTEQHSLGGQGVMPLIDQCTGRQRGAVCSSSEADVNNAIDVALAAKRLHWSKFTAQDRATVLAKAADILERDLEMFAQAESCDTGKPLNLSRRLDIPRSIANLRFFAGLLTHTGFDGRHGGGADSANDAALNYSLRKPLAGVVGLITPWNLPLYLLTWKLAPALVMGNVVVAKPSELTPTTAVLLARVLQEAGLPDGVFNVVHGTGATVGAALTQHRSVSALSFTGGTLTGRSVAAAVAPRFAKLSLEMGGKNALVVFADCDFDLTVQGAARAAYLNSGQICLCPERILVEKTTDGFHERFRDAFVAEAKKLIVGDPMTAATDCGPLISQDQLQKVTTYCRLAEQEGGRLLCGGPDDPTLEAKIKAGELNSGGNWCAPIAIDYGCDVSSRTACEEVFGPFVTFHTFDSDAEAIDMANFTNYGLAASVWSENITRAHDVAAKLDAGTVWINCWLHRQLHMPFGGVKHSGVSREGGVHSLDFYSEAATICLKLGPTRHPPPMPGFVAQQEQRRGYSSIVRTAGTARQASSATAVADEVDLNTIFDESQLQKGDVVKTAPKPLGAYPHARRVGQLLYLSGIGPRHPDSTDTDVIVPGGFIEDPATGKRNDYDVVAQTRQCIDNVERVLAANGLTLNDCIDVTCYLVDMKRDFKNFNSVYAERFGVLSTPPTRTTMEVPQLPPGGRIAVELKVVAAFSSNT